MKLKEFFKSVKQSCLLKRIPAEQIKKPRNVAPDIVVSLTSIPSRINTIDLTIRSILAQSVQPSKITLWLHSDLEQQIPEKLNELQGEIFSIHFTNDLTCSHRKLIYSLEQFPNKNIVTCDDDLLYANDWLNALLTEHQKHPNNVIANECRIITYQNGEPLPYKQWQTLTEHGRTGFDLLPIGYGGVLYPANALYHEVADSELFLNLAPKADDLWFKVMSLLNGTEVTRPSSPPKKPTPIIGSQKVSLKKTNVNADGNRQQWIQICKHYKLTEQHLYR